MKTKTKRLSEAGLVRRLMATLEAKSAVRSVRTFDEAGLLTSNKGLVVRLNNGQEFQLTVVESTRR